MVDSRRSMKKKSYGISHAADHSECFKTCFPCCGGKVNKVGKLAR